MPQSKPIKRKGPGGRPTQKESARRKEKLLDIAQDEFLRQGYTETSVDRIAKRSGVSKATIYSHFTNKENLFEVISLRSVKDLRPAWRAIPQEGRDPADVLYDFARVIYAGTSLPDSLDTLRLAIAEAKQFPNISRAIWERRYETMAPLAEYMERLIKQNLIREDKPDAFAVSFINLVNNHTDLLIDGPIEDKSDLEEHLQRAVAIFLGGVSVD